MSKPGPLLHRRSCTLQVNLAETRCPHTTKLFPASTLPSCAPCALTMCNCVMCRAQRTNGTSAGSSQWDNVTVTLDEIPCTSLCIRAAKTSLCAPVSGDPAFNFPVNDRIRCYCAQVGAWLCPPVCDLLPLRTACALGTIFPMHPLSRCEQS